MKAYTSTIPYDLARELRNQGMNMKKYVPPLGVIATNIEFIPPTYAEVFDWLYEHNWFICTDFHETTKFLVRLYNTKNEEDDFVAIEQNVEKAWNRCIEEAITILNRQYE